jgi:hypothetical protein
MSDHSHVMGGSSATKRINCPASYQLEAAMPEGTESSSYADRGSMLHAAMELLLTADPANAIMRWTQRWRIFLDRISGLRGMRSRRS